MRWDVRRRWRALAAATLVVSTATPLLPSAAYAGTNRWTSAGQSQRIFNSIAVHPVRSNIVYAATDWGLVKSVNGGDSWTAINSGLFDGDVMSMSIIAISPVTPGTLYAVDGTRVPEMRLIPEGGNVFKSVDAGETWTKVLASSDYNATVHALALDPLDGDVAYVGTDGAGVLKTVDGGELWEPASTGLVPAVVYALAIDPNAPATLYASLPQGSEPDTRIMTTADGGDNWVFHSNVTAHLEGYTSALVVHPETSGPWGIVYGHAAEYRPAGWAEGVSEDFDVGHTVLGITPDATNGRLIYAAIEGSGIWRVEAPAELGLLEGARLNKGLTDLDARSVTTAPSSPNEIWAGTDSGIFRFTRKLPTALSLQVTKTRSRVVAGGELSPPHPDSMVAVAMYSKRDGPWKRVASKRAALSIDGHYHTSFARVPGSSCKVVVRFAEDADHLGASRSKTFAC